MVTRVSLSVWYRNVDRKSSHSKKKFFFVIILSFYLHEMMNVNLSHESFHNIRKSNHYVVHMILMYCC